jgi:hypothetical protein
MSFTDPQPLACSGQKCPPKAVRQIQAEPGYVLTPGVTTAGVEKDAPPRQGVPHSAGWVEQNRQ